MLIKFYWTKWVSPGDIEYHSCIYQHVFEHNAMFDIVYSFVYEQHPTTMYIVLPFAHLIHLPWHHMYLLENWMGKVSTLNIDCSTGFYRTWQFWFLNNKEIHVVLWLGTCFRNSFENGYKATIIRYLHCLRLKQIKTKRCIHSEMESQLGSSHSWTFSISCTERGKHSL